MQTEDTESLQRIMKIVNKIKCVFNTALKFFKEVCEVLMVGLIFGLVLIVLALLWAVVIVWMVQ